MKKVLLSIVAVATLASCGDKTAYNIRGTIQGVDIADSTMVYLKQYDGNYKTSSTVDSTIVWDGTFSFTGNQVEPAVRILEIPGQRVGTWVILEPGNITISVDSTAATVGGTASNDSYASLTAVGKKIGEQLQPLYAKAKTTTDITEKRNLALETEKLEEEYKENVVSFLNANITNEIGATLFAQTYYMLNEAELEDMLAKIPANYQSSERYENIKKNAALQADTKVGNKFIDVKGLSPDGKEVALSDYAGKGKIVLVDFWASWCPPCVADMPFLVDAYAKYKDQGFEIVGVSIDDDNAKWQSRIEELGITWPQVSDLKGWQSELSKPYAVSSIPHTVLLDKDGTIIEKKLSGAKLDAKLKELLK